MSKPTEKDKDSRTVTAEAAFVAERVYPDAAAAFGPARPPLSKVLSKCDIVLDTNVLLLPYRAGPSSLEHVASALKKVRDGGRLFIPGRVAREFARLRPAKLAELHHTLSDQTSRAQVPDQKSYPLLDGIPEYAALSEAADALRKAKDAYTKTAATLLGVIRSWNGDDPVSKVYRELFTQACVRDLAIDEAALLKDLGDRFNNDIPPGYKDAAKSDGGVGDLIIWMTILDIGRERQKPLVFVTGEEKADWYHKSAGQAFLPRFELVDEYRRASSGQALYLSQMSELLELLKADKDTVAEIQEEERRERELVEESVDCPSCGYQHVVLLRVGAGSSAVRRCEGCGDRFHVHRGPEGAFSRAWGSRRTSDSIDVRERGPREDVVVACPYCQAGVTWRLGTQPGDSAQPACHVCDNRFHAHRGHDGTPFTRRTGTSPPPGFSDPDRW